MKPEEAKQISDKKNEPLIEKFWKKNSLDDFFFKSIKEAAEKGEYHYDIVIPSKEYNVGVAKNVYEKLLGLGYGVEIEVSDKIKTTIDEKQQEIPGWLVRIKWDN